MGDLIFWLMLIIFGWLMPDKVKQKMVQQEAEEWYAEHYSEE